MKASAMLDKMDICLFIFVILYIIYYIHIGRINHFQPVMKWRVINSRRFQPTVLGYDAPYHVSVYVFRRLKPTAIYNPMRGMGLEMFAETQTGFYDRFILPICQRPPADTCRRWSPAPAEGGWGVSSVNYNSTLWVRLAQERILIRAFIKRCVWSGGVTGTSGISTSPIPVTLVISSSYQLLRSTP